MDNRVDIKENYIRDLDNELLSILLIDRTTKRNIIWATSDYALRGLGYSANDPITISAITGKHGSIIRPRIEKSKQEIQKRIRGKAEVFTPSWVCNAQNNLIDEAWFGRKDVFNIESEKGWTTNTERILFDFVEDKSWRDYVKANRLEITCGEAPYIVSRYDTVSGEIIPIERRIGLLDRKLRVVNENAMSDEEWLEWATWAFKSVYAYDWQGDNVLLARENLLFTFIDYYCRRFAEHNDPFPPTNLLREIAKIISWNVWQMDGLKCVVPNSCKTTRIVQYSLFSEEENIIGCDGCKSGDVYKHNGEYCKIMDWQANKSLRFVTTLKNKG